MGDKYKIIPNYKKCSVLSPATRLKYNVSDFFLVLIILWSKWLWICRLGKFCKNLIKAVCPGRNLLGRMLSDLLKYCRDVRFGTERQVDTEAHLT